MANGTITKPLFYFVNLRIIPLIERNGVQYSAVGIMRQLRTTNGRTYRLRKFVQNIEALENVWKEFAAVRQRIAEQDGVEDLLQMREHRQNDEFEQAVSDPVRYVQWRVFDGHVAELMEDETTLEVNLFTPHDLEPNEDLLNAAVIEALEPWLDTAAFDALDSVPTNGETSAAQPNPHIH